MKFNHIFSFFYKISYFFELQNLFFLNNYKFTVNLFFTYFYYHMDKYNNKWIFVFYIMKNKIYKKCKKFL